jgi:hypothetical protein
MQQMEKLGNKSEGSGWHGFKLLDEIGNGVKLVVMEIVLHV